MERGERLVKCENSFPSSSAELMSKMGRDPEQHTLQGKTPKVLAYWQYPRLIEIVKLIALVRTKVISKTGNRSRNPGNLLSVAALQWSLSNKSSSSYPNCTLAMTYTDKQQTGSGICPVPLCTLLAITTAVTSSQSLLKQVI